ncbi:hemicentin-2-like isoform X2 [Anthonomus grandis grandis]|uniref:hemicentin-2-like isoform X2 n=1 Tax=Anthonomus grandis grandis TaxID=2921223 RepID=UPI0021657D91|nr:hemicentin-2-like isoform X2 [Anthonomus grandis grandis]
MLMYMLRGMMVSSWWMMVFLQFSTVFSGGEAAHAVKRFTGLYTGPYFDPTTATNITTQLGTHAYLPCKVKQLGNKSVSWIRKRDAHILTVDRYTFIADDRFQAFLVESTETWTLQVKYVQARDAGQYECQVSTEPKMSHFITLNVVVPKIEIVGEPDRFVKVGSKVELRCVITQALEEPAYIFWYHDGQRVLKYDKSAIDIQLEREAPETTISTLVIYYANPEDSGNYTCSPSNLDSSSVLLHVLNGEHPAAMQRGKNSASPIPGWSHLSVALGLAACTPPRFAIAFTLTLAMISELISY